jgi:hypothetical protein
MPFWRRAASGAAPGAARPVPDPRVAVPASGATLQVAELFTTTDRFLAGVVLGDDRLTDVLNVQETLRVARIDASLDASSWPPFVAAPNQVWTDLPVADLLLVMPPWQLTDPKRRLHRPAQSISIAIGPYVVEGYVHVPPGAQADGYLARTNPRFVPITNAVIQLEGDPHSDRSVAVVLANLRHAHRLRPPSPPIPDLASPDE